jgi:hypothetical protein
VRRWSRPTYSSMRNRLGRRGSKGRSGNLARTIFVSGGHVAHPIGARRAAGGGTGAAAGRRVRHSRRLRPRHRRRGGAEGRHVPHYRGSLRQRPRAHRRLSTCSRRARPSRSTR